MTNADGREIGPPGTIDDQKADEPLVVEPAATPHPIDPGVKSPDQYESYDSYLYRIRAHRTNAEIAMRAKDTGNDGGERKV